MTAGGNKEPTPVLPPSRGQRFSPWLAGLVLILVIVAAYANTFRVPFLYDDTESIPSNRSLRSFQTAWFPPVNGGITPAGRPILNVSFAANYAVHGTNVVGYHVVNLAIHALAAVTLFGIVRRTLGRSPGISEVGLRARARGSEEALGIAFAVAAIWGLHPLQTESVTYISQRAESLMGLFYLLTLYAFARAMDSSRPIRWLSVCVVACALGMSCKEVMATAPVMVLLYDRTFVAGSFRAALKTRWRFYAGLALTWIPLGWFVLQTGGNRGGTFMLTFAGFRDYWLTQFGAIVRYLQLSFWPRGLIFDYGTFWIKNYSEVILPAAIVFALLGASLWCFWRRPVIGFLAAFFWLILAPSSLGPGRIQMIVEHRMYLSLAPLAIAAVAGTTAWLGSRVLVGWLAIAVALGVVTFRRNADYRSVESIWADTVRKLPGNDRAWCCLGMSLFEAGKIPEAREVFAKAQAIAPENPDILLDLGQVQARSGEITEAEATFRALLKKAPQVPEAHYNLGVLLAGRGESTEAVQHFEQAVTAKPDDVSARFNLANTLVQLDRSEEAIPHYRVALKLEPEKSDVRNNYASTLLRLGRASEALVLLDPSTATTGELQLTRSLALIAAGRRDDAVRELEALLRQNSNWAEAHSNLGLALIESGRLAEGATHYEAALRLGSESFSVRTKINLHVSLAEASLQLGRAANAVTHYQAALALAPGDEELRAALDRAQAAAKNSRSP